MDKMNNVQSMHNVHKVHKRHNVHTFATSATIHITSNDKGQTVGHSGQAAASKNTLGPSAYIPHSLLLAPVLLAEWNPLEACFIVIHSHSLLHLCAQA